MILLTAVYIINIVVIMGLIGYLMFSVMEMKYGLYWSVIRSLFHRDHVGIQWLSNNPVKLIDCCLIIILFFIDMTLIGKLMESDILTRPIFVLGLSPIAWGLVFLYIWFTTKKIKSLEDK